MTALLVGACGQAPSSLLLDGQSAEPHPSARWEPLPAAPLSPRGGTAWFAHDGTLYIFGGSTFEPDSFEAPDCESSGTTFILAAGPRFELACQYPVPEPEPASGAAALDLASGQWHGLDAPSWSDAGRMHVEQGQAVGFRGDLYDPAEDSWTEVPLSAVLAYGDRWWTGQQLVEAGCIYEPDSGIHGQFAAATWSPGDPEWVAHPFGEPGPMCAEGAATVWFDGQLLAFGLERSCAPSADACVGMAGFDPEAGWTPRPETPPGGHVLRAGDDLLLVADGVIHRVDPGTGATEALTTVPLDSRNATPPPAAGEGAVVFVDRDPRTVDLWYDVHTDRWWQLPALPDADQPPTDEAVIELVEDFGLIVWGGRARFDEPSRNSADGYRLVMSSD